ncbi:hypothetical protein [Micromonospora sp. NPDC003241]
MLFVGPAAERRFGHRHFMEMLSVFTAPPQFTVLAGRTELGRVDPVLLTEETTGPRRLLLAGLTFGAALPPRLAQATLAARLADLPGARAVLAMPTQFRSSLA